MKKRKVRTIRVEDGETVFIEFPRYRLPTVQILGATTGSIRLLPLDKPQKSNLATEEAAIN